MKSPKKMASSPSPSMSSSSSSSSSSSIRPPPPKTTTKTATTPSSKSSPKIKTKNGLRHHPSFSKISKASTSSSSSSSSSNALTTTTSNALTSSSSFKIMVTGQIESASFPSTMNNLYCRYVVSYGQDWNVTHGVTSGLSQISQWHYVHNKNVYGHCHGQAHDYSCSYVPTIVWNFPIDISFQSTNAYGWPRISIAVYGLDFFGRDVVRGYGSLLIPIPSSSSNPSMSNSMSNSMSSNVGGQYVEYIELYRPISGSICHQFMNWINGTLPEYYETVFTAQGEGRAFTRVVGSGSGSVKVVLNVIVKDMKKFGFRL